MKFLHCVTSGSTKRNSRNHRKSSRRRRRNSRSSYLSPTGKRRFSHQTDNLSGIRMNNSRNAFQQSVNDHNEIDINPTNYVEMGVPPTIFEHQVYSNSQKLQYNPLHRMNARVYPSTSSGYQLGIMNQNSVPRGNVFNPGVDKKRRRRVSQF